MNDDLVHAYAAGFFDGEGNITRVRRSVWLTAWQIDPGPLILLRDHYGGSVYLRGPNKWRRNPIYLWSTNKRITVIQTLVLWYPYLVVKRAQAVAALEYYQTHPVQSSKMSKPYFMTPLLSASVGRILEEQ